MELTNRGQATGLPGEPSGGLQWQWHDTITPDRRQHAASNIESGGHPEQSVGPGVLDQPDRWFLGLGRRWPGVLG